MIEMRKKRKPTEYKNISKVVLALPDEDGILSRTSKSGYRNQRIWFLSTTNKRGLKNSDRQIASNLQIKTYIRMWNVPEDR